MEPQAVTAPLRADAERNRQRLLAAARELFAQRGVDVSLDDIARHAGVGVGTAYRRFPNKHALIEELMVEKLEELGRIARRCLEEEDDPWAGLTGYLEQALDLQCRHRGLKDVLFSSSEEHARLAEVRARLAPIITALVERAVAAGVVRPDLQASDVPLLSIMLSTAGDFARDVEPELHRRYLQIVLDGLRPAREASTPLAVDALEIGEFQQAMSRWHRRR
nr:TetR/AcrR family transcriptional regulator [Conexibacter sp. SYSU D00693]